MGRWFVSICCAAFFSTWRANATCFLTCSRANTDGTTTVTKQCFRNLGWLTDLGACEKMAKSLDSGQNVCTGKWAPFQTCDDPQEPPPEPSDTGAGQSGG